MQPTWGWLSGASSKGVPSILTVPLFPGGLDPAQASPVRDVNRAATQTARTTPGSFLAGIGASLVSAEERKPAAVVTAGRVDQAAPDDRAAGGGRAGRQPGGGHHG